MRNVKIITNVLLLLFSLICALLLSELALRLISPHTPTFGSFYPEYVVDGLEVDRPLFVTGDDVMPYRLKPNSTASIVVRENQQTPFTVTLDRHGYRNGAERDEYDAVVVGDSVVWGWGVSDHETITSYLNEYHNTYNLAIPGAGPEMYMPMLDGFLKRSRAGKLVVFFYENDIYNLDDAWWEGMVECSPPDFSSRIVRNEVSPSPESPSGFFYYPLVKDSYLASKFHALLQKKPPVEKDSVSLYNLYHSIAVPALGEINVILNNEAHIGFSLDRIREALAGISQSGRCLDNTVAREIDGMALSLINFTGKNNSDIDSGAYTDAARYYARKAKEIAGRFEDRACYPIGKGKNNLVKEMHNAAYNIEYGLDLREGNHRGHVYLYRSFLEQMEDDFPPEVSGIVDDLAEEAENMKSYMKIRKLHAQLEERLKEPFPAEKCNKVDIFMRYLSSLKASGKVEDVVVFSMPSEKKLRYFGDRRLIEENEHVKFLLLDYFRICEIASSNGLACHDLSGRFARHYSNPGNNALTFDDVHLTREGSELVARWIMELSPFPGNEPKPL